MFKKQTFYVEGDLETSSDKLAKMVDSFRHEFDKHRVPVVFKDDDEVIIAFHDLDDYLSDELAWIESAQEMQDLDNDSPQKVKVALFYKDKNIELKESFSIEPDRIIDVTEDFLEDIREHVYKGEVAIESYLDENDVIAIDICPLEDDINKTLETKEKMENLTGGCEEDDD